MGSKKRTQEKGFGGKEGKEMEETGNEKEGEREEERESEGKGNV